MASQRVSWKMQTLTLFESRTAGLDKEAEVFPSQMRGEVSSMRGSLGQAQRLNAHVKALSRSEKRQRSCERSGSPLREVLSHQYGTN